MSFTIVLYGEEEDLETMSSKERDRILTRFFRSWTADVSRTSRHLSSFLQSLDGSEVWNNFRQSVPSVLNRPRPYLRAIGRLSEADLYSVHFSEFTKRRGESLEQSLERRLSNSLNDFEKSLFILFKHYLAILKNGYWREYSLTFDDYLIQFGGEGPSWYRRSEKVYKTSLWLKNYRAVLQEVNEDFDRLFQDLKD